MKEMFMDVEAKKIKNTEYKTTTWSGGDTTEIYIFPETAKYSDRDFEYRVSIATVLQDSSDFTKLEQYDRILTVLEGEVNLKQEQQKVMVHLGPFDQFIFEGNRSIKSYGQCRDFNLMFRKGLQGQVSLWQMKEEEMDIALDLQTDYVLYLIKGECNYTILNKRDEIHGGEALILNHIQKKGLKLKITRKDENTIFALCHIASNSN